MGAILKLRRSPRLLALCGLVPSLVQAGLLSASILLHTPHEIAPAGLDDRSDGHVHDFRIGAGERSAQADGACPGCTLERSPAVSPLAFDLSPPGTTLRRPCSAGRLARRLSRPTSPSPRGPPVS